MTPNQIAAYVPVIRAIEQASGKELRAIARVEQAIKGAIGQGIADDTRNQPDTTPRQPKAKVYDPKRARRQQAEQHSSSQAEPVDADEFLPGKKELADLTKAVTNIRPAAIKQAVTQAAKAPDLNQAALSSQIASAVAPLVNAKPEVAEQPDVVAAIAQQSKAQIRAQDETNAILAGMYQDEQGRWRQENGAFATRQQKEIIAGTQSGPDEIKQSGFAKILNWAKGRFTEDRQEDALDAAGMAVGGSAFLAGKEMYQLAKSAKNMISRGKDSLPSLGKSDKSLIEPAQTTEAVAAAKTKPAMRRQAVDFAFSLFRNPKRAFLSLFQRVARGDLDKQATDSKAIYSVNQSGAKGSAKAPIAMSAAELSRTDRQSDLMRDAIDDQTTALTLAINETTEAIKDLKLNVDTGEGLLDMVGDFFGRGRRGRGGRSGRKPTWRERMGGWGSDKRQPAGAKRAPGRMGSYTGMGTGPAGGRGPSSPTMWEKTKGWFTGKPVGAAAQTGASAAGAAAGGGKMAGALRMGGTILSRLALPLTAALAVFDGFKGFTDSEGQKRAFNLRDGEEASFGQKSAMAAGQVLSAGGLTEMLFGVSGDDIARTLYEFFGGSPRGHALAPYQPVKAGAFSSAGMAAATKTGATQAQTVGKSPMVMASTTPAPKGTVRSSNEYTDIESMTPVEPGTAKAPPKGAGSMMYASAVPAPAVPAVAPPAPAPAPVKAEQKPAVVVAQLDQKSLKALSDANKPAPAPAQQSTTNNVENIRMQTKSPGQVPLAASDQLMHLQSLDRM
jgi:hypothetical protein